MPKTHVENLNFREVKPSSWRPPGFPSGAQVRVLAHDSETGALTCILELAADFRSLGSARCDAEMQLFVLQGELKMGAHILAAGSYCYYPGRAIQPAWQSRSAVMALAIFSKAPRFAAVADSDVEATETSATSVIPALDTWAMQWTNPLDAADPSIPFRTGVMVKVLREDPVTGASTHLAGLMPGWFSYGMETHPVYEENYCLSGDVHVAEVGSDPGYTMTEGAFLCRPAGIPHGPVLSKNGNVNFVYAHGRLGINYVDNPRSEELVTRHLRTYPWR